MARNFEVSAEWMTACGLGSHAFVFPVLREWNMEGLTFVEVDATQSPFAATIGRRPWVLIAKERGNFVD